MSRISPGTIIVAIFALLFGLVGAYVVRQSLQRPVAEAQAAPAPPRPTVVPMAGMDLPADRPITLGDIAVSQMTTEQLKERKMGGFMTNTQQIIGRTLREPLKKGETFKPDMFYPDGTGPSLATKLEPGQRAVTVPIAQDVVGFASPGTMVDIIFRTSPEPGSELPETTVTLLENVRVLALGRSIVPGATSPPTSRRSTATTSVTLAVGPEQASALKIVEGRGDLMLTLRNPDDGSFAEDVEPQTLDGLLGWAGPPQSLTTDVFRGNAKQTVAFDAIRPAPAQSRLSSLPVRKRSTTVPTATPDTAPNGSAPPAPVPPTQLPDEATRSGALNVPAAGQTGALAPTTIPAQADRQPASTMTAPVASIATDMVANDNRRRPAVATIPTGRFVTQRFDRAHPSEVAFHDGQRLIEVEPVIEAPLVDEDQPALPASLMTRPPGEQPSVLFSRPGVSSRRSASKIINIPAASTIPSPAGR